MITRRTTGELRSLDEHLISCGFTFVPCSNECKDKSGQIVKQKCKDLRKHKSKCPRHQYKCRHCKEAGEYLKRTTIHLKKCPRMKIACPNNNCKKRVARYDLEIHCGDCPFEPVPCKYVRIGCNSRFPRREREEYESNAEHHFQMAVDTVSELRVKLDSIVEEQTSIHVFTLSSKELATSQCIAPHFTQVLESTKCASRCTVMVWVNKKVLHVCVCLSHAWNE